MRVNMWRREEYTYGWCQVAWLTNLGAGCGQLEGKVRTKVKCFRLSIGTPRG